MSHSKAPSLEPPMTAEPPPVRLDEDSVVRVGGTRVTLDTIVAAFQNGDTPEEMARNYDALSLREVYQAIGYYLAHQPEVEAYLERRRAARDVIQQEVEAQHNPSGIRARLLARRRPAAP